MSRISRINLLYRFRDADTYAFHYFPNAGVLKLLWLRVFDAENARTKMLNDQKDGAEWGFYLLNDGFNSGREVKVIMHG